LIKEMTVPSGTPVARPSGHSVTTAAEFTYAELHEPATATMRGLPPDDPTIDQGPAK
jgi:hypothetical protein